MKNNDLEVLENKITKSVQFFKKCKIKALNDGNVPYEMYCKGRVEALCGVLSTIAMLRGDRDSFNKWYTEAVVYDSKEGTCL